jgi:hypothetical protein
MPSPDANKRKQENTPQMWMGGEDVGERERERESRKSKNGRS